MRKDITKLLKLAVLVGAALLLAIACRSTKQNLNKPVENANTPAPVQPVSQSAFDVVDSKVIERISPFIHTRKEHQTKTKDCAFCHVRKDNSATPLFPGHSACIECHQKDFTAKESRMCEVCHTTPVDAKGTRIDFPKKQSEFALKGFSHRQHGNAEKMKDQVDAAQADAAHLSNGVPGCALCHNFDASAAVASFPDHPQCYICHTHQANQKLADCGVCHIKKDQGLAFSRGTGPAFALYNFRHGPHLKKSECARCHKTTEVPAQEVRADIAEINVSRGQRHHSMCWECHVQAKESVCTKCHVAGRPF